MNDDELERLLRDAWPDLPHRDDPLTEWEQQMLADIKASAPSDVTPPVAVSTRRRQPARILLAAACLLVVAAISLISVVYLSTPAAHAATPPRLVATPVNQTAAEVLMQAAAALPTAGGMPATHRFQTWALASEPDGAGNLASFVQPLVVTARSDGETTTMTWEAGVPDPVDAPGALPVGSPASDYPPVTLPTVFVAPPTGADEYAPYFAERVGLAQWATTGDYLQAVQILLNERRLSGLQEAAMLQFLGTLPDLAVDGVVTDRLGRPGVELSTESRAPGEFRDTLIVSTTGGGIIAAETIYIGKDRADIQAPSVVLYHAWER